MKGRDIGFLRINTRRNLKLDMHVRKGLIRDGSYFLHAKGLVHGTNGFWA